MFEILRLRLHYVVIMTSYVGKLYLFSYRWKEETLYSDSKHKDIGRLLKKIQSGLKQPPPPFGGRVRENGPGVRGLTVQYRQNCHEIYRVETVGLKNCNYT